MHPIKGYTFDDVLLIPKFSEIKSRGDVDTSVDLGKGCKLKIPIVSANMKNVTGSKMAEALTSFGGLPILHRFYDDNKSYLNTYKRALLGKTPMNLNDVGISLGVNGGAWELIEDFMDYEFPPKVICVDVAHGDSKACADMTSYIATKYPEVLLIAGNVSGWPGAQTLYNAGADVIKVGVGPGSLCTTRLETGNGVPQLSALASVYDYATESFTIKDKTDRKPAKFKIIADGGIKYAGDIVKALCFSDAVMLGNLLAGTDEAPGNIIRADGKSYKEYVGSSTHKKDHVEGVSALVPYKGPVRLVIKKLMDGIRSGMSYQNATRLDDLKTNPEFVSISNAGLVESAPHDVNVV